MIDLIFTFSLYFVKVNQDMCCEAQL